MDLLKSHRNRREGGAVDMSKTDYGVGVYEERLRVLAIIAEEIDSMLAGVPDGVELPASDVDYIKTLMTINYKVATEGWEE